MYFEAGKSCDSAVCCDLVVVRCSSFPRKVFKYINCDFLGTLDLDDFKVSIIEIDMVLKQLGIQRGIDFKDLQVMG